MTAHIAAANLRSLVALASTAPSSHNTQPWFFELERAGIKLFADRTRALPTNDPFDRELSISCGAALFTLEIAAQSEGHAPVVELFPEPADPDVLARISLGPRDQSHTCNGELAALRAAIERRHTTRGAFDSAIVARDFIEALEHVADQHAVAVHFDLDRDRLADLVAQGDQSQFGDPHWRRELASWSHHRRIGDGLAATGGRGFSSKVVVTADQIGSPIAESDHRLVEAAPVVVALTTADDDAENWIAAGRALQHLLLTATAAGMSAGYLNQPCQVPTLRTQLRQLIGGDHYPQVVLRFGSAGPPDTRTPRRPLGEMILKPSS